MEERTIVIEYSGEVDPMRRFLKNIEKVSEWELAETTYCANVVYVTWRRKPKNAMENLHQAIMR